ncbi:MULTISPECIES: transposase [Mesorhizobium]|uniref:transposase n=1 Tax=Mesorhizobium sp. TaxID=1871066 RepID=UPI0024780EBB|nr:MULTISPECIES: transposase [Mesorhizobium]
MNDLTLPLGSLSSVGGKSVVARFDGGMLSSNSGVLALAEVEKRLRVAERLARCIDDPRCPDQTAHSLADIIGFRMKMIAAGYEDGNDANRLRSDPVFKMAQDALPSGRDLASQSTMCRLERHRKLKEREAVVARLPHGGSSPRDFCPQVHCL